MNRVQSDNPILSGYVVQSLQFSPGGELEAWQKTVPASIPHGHRVFARWEGGYLNIGLEPIPTKEVGHVVVSEDLNGLSLAELQTRCGMSGIKYEKNESAVSLIGKLSAKKGGAK